jgi:hypothetical protein
MEMLALGNALARVLALNGLRVRNPAALETELHRRLAGILLGDERARKVYGEISAAATTFCGSSIHFNDPYHFHAAHCTALKHYTINARNLSKSYVADCPAGATRRVTPIYWSKPCTDSGNSI